MEVFTNTVVKQKNEPGKTAMSGIKEAEVGPPPVYGGSESALNPEEMFVAAINSCIMLVFYHFADKLGVEVESYSSAAQGKVDKTKKGLRFTGVEVEAEVLPGEANQSEKIKKIAQLAEEYCLVSGSVACPVHYSVEVVSGTGPVESESDSPE